MAYLYRWTISYYATGPRGTPLNEYEYYYNVYTRRRLSKARYKRVEQSLRRRSRYNQNKYHRGLRAAGGRIERGKIVERTSIEKPLSTRSKRERIEGKALRMKVKEGRAIPTDLYDKKREKRKAESSKAFRKRVTTKEFKLPQRRRKRK
jgi:hypothetical protein